MTPKIEISNGQYYGMRVVEINDKRIGSAITEAAAEEVIDWLVDAWPELVVEVLASSHVEQPKKKRKV